MKRRTSAALHLTRPLCKVALLFALLSAVALGLGCGDSSGAKDQVHGKVTLNGEGVSGFVVLVGSDKKEAQGPLLNGTYHVDNPPKGEVDVLIRGMAGMAAPPGPKPKESPTTTLPSSGSGVAPPPKYATPGALPKLKVTGGKQKHDITLQP